MKIKKIYADGSSAIISFGTEAEAVAHFNQEKKQLEGFMSEPFTLETDENSFTVLDGAEVEYQVILIK